MSELREFCAKLAGESVSSDLVKYRLAQVEAVVREQCRHVIGRAPSEAVRHGIQRALERVLAEMVARPVPGHYEITTEGDYVNIRLYGELARLFREQEQNGN